MGHLHIIANTIHESSIKSAQLIESNPERSSEFNTTSGAGDGGDGGNGGNGGDGSAKSLSAQLLPPPPSSPMTEEAARRSASIKSLAK